MQKSDFKALGAFVLGFIAIASIAAVQSTARFPSIELRDFLTIIGGPSTTNHIGGNATVISNWLALSGTTNRITVASGNLRLDGKAIGGNTSISSNSVVTNLFAEFIYVSNIFVTNISSEVSYVSNIFVTNLFGNNAKVSNFFVTNLFSENSYFSNVFVTNIYVSGDLSVGSDANLNTLSITNWLSLSGTTNRLTDDGSQLLWNGNPVGSGGTNIVSVNGGDGILVTSGTNISTRLLGGTDITLTTNSGVITINASSGGGSVSNVISVFNVKNYGAVGDGSQDDRPSITNATQLAANAGGGIVYFPPGAYLVPSQINWPISSNVTWMGAGMGASHIVMDVGGDPALTIGLRIHSGDVNTPIQFVTIKDLTIRSPDATDSATWDLIQTGDYVFDMMVERVEFKWARHSGLRSAPNSPSTKGWRQTVKNCYFHNIQNPPMTDIAGAALLGIHHDALVEGTVFENIGQGSLFHATYLGQADTVGIRMLGNSFRGTNLHTRMGMDGENQKGVVVTGNTFDNGARNFMSGFNGATIAGNIFRNSGLQIGGSDMAIVANEFYMDRNEGGSFINTFIQNGSPSTNVSIKANSFVNALPDNSTNLVIGILPSGGGVRWMIKDNDFSGYIQSAQLTAGGFHHFINNDVNSSRDGRIFQVNGSTNVIVQMNRFRGLTSGASVDIAAASAPTTTAIENDILGTTTWLNPGSPKIMYVRTDGTNTALTADLRVTNSLRNVRATLAYVGTTNVLPDFNVANSGLITLTGTTHITLTNIPSTFEQTYILHLVQDGTGGRAVTFDTNTIKWPGGTSPTVTTNANAWDVATFVTGPSGTNAAAVIQQHFQ